VIARVPGGRKVGGGWKARCSAHDNWNLSRSAKDADNARAIYLVGDHPEEALACLKRERGLGVAVASRLVSAKSATARERLVPTSRLNR
jgi:hypothetical protein